MIDNHGKPNNGPFRASRTCIMLNSEELTVDYHFDYYMYGQFMKFVKRGAVRIHSDEWTEKPAVPPFRKARRRRPGGRSSHEAQQFANVAFRNPDGTIVLIAANADSSAKQFKIVWNGLMIAPTLSGRSVATYVWNAN